MVGAVGIENNTERNLKDLEEMLGSSKSLKRNNGECKEILIGPSMAPHFSGTQIRCLFSLSVDEERRRLPVKSRGTDGKPTTTLFGGLTSILRAAIVCLCTGLTKAKRTNSRVGHGKMPCLEAS